MSNKITEEKQIRIANVIKVSEFIDTKYRDFWKEENLSVNVFLPQEQFMQVEKRILWAASKIGMLNSEKTESKFKTTELSGETLKYHISGETSVQDSIKGLATNYKRQKAVRLFKGIGNMGVTAGDPGSAARYTSIQGTPLLSAIIRDLEYAELITDSTGLLQPKYIVPPLPMVLINGKTSIGMGKSAYYDEREASEVIDWIEKLVNKEECTIPDPICSTGCKTYKIPNGYTMYESTIETKGRYDIITTLPPKSTSRGVMSKLKSKLPKRAAEAVIDGSGDGRPTYIMVPKGHLKMEDYSKYGLKNGRKEATYIWDESLDTMRMSSHEEVAILWFKARRDLINKKLESKTSKLEAQINKIDLIKLYVDKKMNTWKSEEIENELGKDNANIVLSSPAKVFLPENLAKNEILREKYVDEIKEIKSRDINKEVFVEAREIIKLQEAYDFED